MALTPVPLLRAQSVDAVNPPSVTQTLIFLRSAHPVFVQLTVLLDGQELRAARALKVNQVFRGLDANRDGLIDSIERDSAPTALRKLGVREKWTTLLPRLDLSPTDQQISAQEFATFADQLFGPPIVLAARPRGIRRAGQAVELFDLLDDDQNQLLSEAEFAALATRLHKLDADGDDSFSVIEVEPFRNPFSPRMAVVQPEDSAWVPAEIAAEILLTRFDRQLPSLSLSAIELGVDPKLISAADANQDGELNLEELRQWLPTAPPRYHLTVNLPQGKTRLTNLAWTEVAALGVAPRTGLSRPKPPVKSLETMIAGQPLQLQVSASRASQNDNLAFYRLQFRRSDQDKNKYLDPTEFPSLNLPEATFEMVDADGNGQIFDAELQEFLQLETLVDQGHVQVTYDSNEISLFSVLDVNKDNRLTPRECLRANTVWKQYDTNRDGQLARPELSGKLRLTVELVKPRLFQDAAVSGLGMTGEPRIVEQTSAPLWFRGMDRNLDGDISRREFLGTDAAFQKWDRDADGLISAAEAGS